MSDERWQNHTKSLSSLRMVGRYALALLILGAVILYLVQSLSGKIHQIDAPTVGLLVVTIVLLILLITPGLTDRLSRIEVSGLKLEILRKEQLRQRDELDEFSLIFPILLPETERKHLMNLAHGSTANYKGNHCPASAEMGQFETGS